MWCGFAEDERRLTGAEQAPPTSSSYGAVATTDDYGEEAPHDGNETPQGLGLGARLYVAVLVVVGLSGLVGLSVPLAPLQSIPFSR